jgi:hypothetical protein
MLEELAIRLAEAGHLQRGLALTQDRVLARLIPYLPQAEQERALQKILERMQYFWDGENYEWWIQELPHLSEAHREQIFRKISAVTPRLEVDTFYRQNQRDKQIQVLTRLIPLLSSVRLLEEMLAVIKWKVPSHRKAEMLVKLTPYLPTELLRKAIIMAQDLRQGKYWSLTGLLSRLADLEGLEKALAVVRQMKDTTLLACLASHLPLELLREAIANEEELWWIHKELVCRLAELGHPEEALEAAVR